MIIVHTATALATEIESLKAAGRKIGFVPTMGALHEGHLGLVRLARESADVVVVSIFVNPTQFAPHEDFGSYPRQVESDVETLATEGVDLVYLPTEGDIYPGGAQVTHRAGAAAEGLESDFRPHFFDGVVTVVHELFSQVRPDVAVFGEKDFQQLQVVREMVAAENLNIEIIGAPIARDEQGLALSSRNAYLSEEELKIARRLNSVLFEAAAKLKGRRGLAGIWRYISAIVFAPLIMVVMFATILVILMPNMSGLGMGILFYLGIVLYGFMLGVSFLSALICYFLKFYNIWRYLLCWVLVGILTVFVVWLWRETFDNLEPLVFGSFLTIPSSVIAGFFSWLIINPRRFEKACVRKEALDHAKTALLAAGFDKVDYVEERWGRVLAAVWLGKTRLIDNRLLAKP